MNEYLLNETELVHVLSCPNCGEKNSKFLPLSLNVKFENDTYIFPNDFGVLHCKNCGLFYKNYFSRPEFEKKIQSYYIKSGEFKRWSAINNKGYQKIIDIITNIQNQKNQKTELLDIGIGEGNFIKMLAENKNFIVSGMEINPVDKFEENFNGVFIEANIEDEVDEKLFHRFDVITLFDVMEHVTNPIKVMKNIKLLLKKGGLLVFETGNADFWFPKYFSISKWWYTNVLEHKVFWSKKSIAYLLENENFEIIQMLVKPHKGGNQPNWKSLISYPIFCISSNLYKLILKILGKKLKKPTKFRFRGKDHILVLAINK